MAKISKRSIESAKLGFFINNLWSLITLLKNKEEVRSFLKGLLTHTEMKMLAKRIQVAKMLREGYTYQQIKTVVKVTDSTITRISNKLETEGEGLDAAIKLLSEIEDEAEKRRVQGKPLKDRYGMYFLPERLVDLSIKKFKQVNKKLSARHKLSL